VPADPLAWLRTTFPTYLQTPAGAPVPFAPRHEDFWRWLWALRPGVAASSFLGIWARGGAKSTSVELGAAVVGYFGLRRYALYISSTQSQADDHVSNVATMLEKLGVERALNTYGYSQGWRVNRLHTADGFTLDAVGMDKAVRGVRRDEDRPDLLCLDDLDDQHDTPLTIEKKIDTLTRKLLPAGAASMAVVGVQNLPNMDGIFARLADGRAEFLLDRTLSGPHPALANLPETDWYVLEPTPEGPLRVRITAGTPTWAGQDLAACESLIAKIGVRAFLVEAQHKIALLEGELFKREWFRVVDDWPHEATLIRFWDFASTAVQPGTDPDWTVGLLVGLWRGQYWLIDMQRVRATPKNVEELVLATARYDGRRVEIWLEQEGGSSGATVVEDYQRRVLVGFTVSAWHPTGSKGERAKPMSSAAEHGNVFVVQGAWNQAFFAEVPLFGLPGVHDDIVDCMSGAHYALTHGSRVPQDLDMTAAGDLTKRALNPRTAPPHEARPDVGDSVADLVRQRWNVNAYDEEDY
jgi:predicted phage terminase large subunit-like protein